MNTYLVPAICLLCYTSAQGQYQFKDTDGAPINIFDLKNSYHTYEQPYVRIAEQNQEQANEKNIHKGKDMDESGDYLFDRWCYYWKQHLDVNKNLVSQAKLWDEWNAYKKAHNINNGRTTGTTNSSNWKFQGPDTPVGDGVGIGRISAIGFHPTNSNTFWVGTDGGGAWKTTDGGNTWTAMTDNLPSLVVSDVDLNPLNPNTVYLCTGDRDHGGWDNHIDAVVGFGVGVLKSYDGGATWDTTGMNWKVSQGQIANCLLVNPQDTNCIILATTGGIYKSMNGGKTFTKKISGNFKQILYNPADTNYIYASLFFDGVGGASAQIFRSTDNGETWTQITSFTKICRIGLAVTPKDPKIVKALTSSGDPAGSLYGIEGVYNSTDSGHTFTKIFNGTCSNNIMDWNSGTSHGCGGQGTYDVMLAIDPNNVNNVYLGGVNAWYSTNGGSSWTILNQWSAFAGASGSVPVVHADKHVSVFNPLNPTRFYECNDGGIFYADNIFSGSTTWHDISTGLGITEFYSNAISDNSLGVTGGAQDNSSLYLYDHALDYVSGGDGMQCQQDPLDSTTLYTSYVYGVIYQISGYYFRAVDYPNDISSNIPGNPSGAWLTPFVLEPSCNYCIIAGYDQLWQSTDQGGTWNNISPVFFSNRYISAISLSYTSPNTIYAVSEDTNIINYSFNMGTNWAQLQGDTGMISAVQVDPRDSTHIWVTYGGYGASRVQEYKPSAGWKRLNNGLPDVPVNCIQLDTEKRMLYVGTDVGVFAKRDTASAWELYNNGLPVVRITQLNISYSRHQLWASTYGRGMWMSPKEDSVQTKPKSVKNVSGEEHNFVLPNPNNGEFVFMAGATYSNKRADMRLIDDAGKTVWSDAGRFDGTGKVQIKTTGLPKGLYFFEAAADNEVIARKKVVIQ
jgi:photosystem II stability/assembly factor-like uncharacterized protein